MKDLSKMRQEYHSDSLNEEEMKKNPFEQFGIWLNAAIEANLCEPNAMTVATASMDGKPSARVVLLKGIEKEGFIFYTNYTSRKGKELLANPYAAAVFDWHEMGRQVRIEGNVKKIDDEDSDAYFNVRPEDAKIGAWASPQSQVIRNRNELENAWKEFAEQFLGKKIPRPPHWGGFIILPSRIEFWQGRPNRMHDRIVYEQTKNGWLWQRLAP